MEQREEIRELWLEKLANEGFSEEQLSGQIGEALLIKLPAFKANCTMDYGEERMSYVLSFVQTTNEKLPYTFSELKATHRDPVDIDHHVINGIDTLALDQLMTQVNWIDAFSAVPDSDSGNLSAALRQIGELRKLADGDPPHGRYTQQCLMYKHWPAEVYQKYRDTEMPDLRKAHEHSYTFKASQGDILNAHLAYHIISERYDSLRDILEGMRLHKIENSFSVYGELIENLRYNPDAFTLTGHFNLPEGYTEFSIPVEKINGWYSIDEYELTFTPYLEIAHGVFGGIDTSVLEAEMRKINWQDDESLFTFSEDEAPTFKGVVNDIQHQLYRVSQEMAGFEVADLLQLKYLTDVTFFGENIDQSAWDHLEDLPKLRRSFPVEQSILSAAYLLAGRAVFSPIGPKYTENEQYWIRLDLSRPQEHYPASLFAGFSRQELEDALRPVCMLSTPTADRSGMASELMEGKRAQIYTATDKTILVEAAPEKKDLLFFTEDLRPIPVNLNMDPDWKPEPSPQERPRIAQKQSTPVKKSGRRKGKGI